jgi:hypothetical protein
MWALSHDNKRQAKHAVAPHVQNQRFAGISVVGRLPFSRPSKKRERRWHLHSNATPVISAVARPPPATPSAGKKLSSEPN